MVTPTCVYLPALNMGESQVAGPLKPSVFPVLTQHVQLFLLLCHNRENHPTPSICQCRLPPSSCWLRKTMCSLYTLSFSCVADPISRCYYLLTSQSMIQSCLRKCLSPLMSGPRTSKEIKEKGTPAFGAKLRMQPFSFSHALKNSKQPKKGLIMDKDK